MKQTHISPRFSPILPPWKRLNRMAKIKEAISYAGAQGGFTINLNFSQRVQDLLITQKNPMQTIRKRMHEELRAMDIHHLPLVLVLEATRPAGKLHLHGVIIPRGCSEERIQKAMRRAAGYVSGHSGSTQFYSTEITDASGWYVYLRKDKAHTRRLMNLTSEKPLWFISRSMTQAVREDYEARRLGHLASANANSAPVSDAG